MNSERFTIEWNAALQEQTRQTFADKQAVAGRLLNVTLPTLNEEQCLVANVRKLVAFLEKLTGVSREVALLGMLDVPVPWVERKETRV